MTTKMNRRPATRDDLAIGARCYKGNGVVEYVTLGAALYRPRMEAFLALDGETPLGDDDGTIVVLLTPGRARDLLAEYGTPGRAAAAANAELRAAGVL
jgi:hypothetical protein